MSPFSVYINQRVDINVLYLCGREFKWNRPKCPKCNAKVWGHGYRKRIFSKFINYIYIKRYRCPKCGTVITMSIDGYWKYYQSSIKKIYSTIEYRLRFKKWKTNTFRQKYRHWLLRFLGFIQMECLEDNIDKLIKKLDLLFYKNIKFIG